MAQLAIKGHKKRGNEVIEILKILGGSWAGYCGFNSEYYYYINECGDIIGTTSPDNKMFVIYTIEEFLEKFPYKVGDKVIDKTDGCVGIVTEMCWKEHTFCVKYGVTFGRGVDFGWYSAQSLQPYKEETMDKAVFDANAQCCDIMNRLIKKEIMEEIKVDIPKGYEFAGIDDNRQQVVFTKIQPEYPKNYDECCKVLGYSGNYNMILTTDVDNKLFNALYRLKVCRDAYWKIACEQMGLGKPWEPDWGDKCQEKWFITTFNNTISCDFCNNHSYVIAKHNHILAFPTAEMQDAFYENFKELIEECKELL